MKMFDDKKLDTIRKLIKFYLDKYSDDNNEITALCKKIIGQTFNQKGKDNNNFYKEQLEIRTSKKYFLITDKMKEKIDLYLVKDLNILNKLIDIYLKKEVYLDLNDEYTLGAIYLFLYECPEMFYIDSINDFIFEKLNEIDDVKESELVLALKNLIKENIEYIRMYEMKVETFAYCQTFISMIFRGDMKEIIDTFNEEELDSLFNEDLLEVIESTLDKNNEICMLDYNKANNIRELVLILHDRKVISNSKLNELKIKLNIFFDEEYKYRNNKFYENQYEIYMNSKVNFSKSSRNSTEKTKRGLEQLMIDTGKFLNMLIDFSLKEDIIIKSSDVLFHLNYIIKVYPELLENKIYKYRIINVIQEYYNNIDESQLILSKNQSKIYNKVKKKIEKSLR